MTALGPYLVTGPLRGHRRHHPHGWAAAPARTEAGPPGQVNFRPALPRSPARSRVAEAESRVMGSQWYYFPMEAVIDQAGRVVLPKPIRDALGLLPGTKVDISPYGAGAQILPAGRTARLIEEDGVLIAAGETPVDDDVIFALIDAGRK
jgi:AbrB family looped-hinge helix DNA binding protein